MSGFFFDFEPFRTVSMLRAGRVAESADMKVNEMLLTGVLSVSVASMASTPSTNAGESEDVSKTHIVKPKKPVRARRFEV